MPPTVQFLVIIFSSLIFIQSTRYTLIPNPSIEFYHRHKSKIDNTTSPYCNAEMVFTGRDTFGKIYMRCKACNIH